MTLSARDRALEWIQRSIITGDLKAGDFIEEATVCHAVGVSRTPVREALNQASVQQFVRLIPKRGAQVRTISAAEVVEIFETRAVIEKYAAKIICQRKIPVTQAALKALRDRVEAAGNALHDRGDLSLITDAALADWRIHVSLVEAAGNSVLTELFNTLQPWQLRVALSVSVYNAQQARLPQIDLEHGELIAAWESHDLETLLKVIDTHLNPSAEIVECL